MKERHQHLALVGLVLAFLVLRALHLTTAIELISFDEELYRGTIAVELVEGLKASLWAYQGWTLRATFGEDRARAVDWIHQLPLEARPSALEGLRACEAWYRLGDG